MKIKIDGVVVKLDLGEFHEIRQYTYIQKEREKTRARKVLDVLINYKKIVNQYKDKTIDELELELKSINRTRINYDRGGMGTSKIPFRTV